MTSGKTTRGSVKKPLKKSAVKVAPEMAVATRILDNLKRVHMRVKKY